MEPADKKAKSVKACETCKKPFGITRIRHTCKRCLKIICAECTKARIKIVTYDMKEAHKICIACEKEHNFQVDFRNMHKPSWNTMSGIGQKWIKMCNPKENLVEMKEGFEETYAGYLEHSKGSYDAKTGEYFSQIDSDIYQGRLDRDRTNYSLQDFLYYNQEKVNVAQIRASISNVLKAFVIKFPSIGYCQGLNYLAFFLLSLMDEESAFWTLGYIVNDLLPPNFYGQTDFGVSMIGFQQEKYVMSNLIKDQLGLDAEMAQKIHTLLDVNGPMLLTPLLVNYSNFQVLFEVWHKMLVSKTLNELRKVVLHMARIFLPTISDSSLVNPVEFQLMVIRLFNAEDFKDAQTIVIRDEHVKFLEAKFRGDYSSQWAVNETKMHHAFRRVTEFKKSQIKTFQDEFAKMLGGNSPSRKKSQKNQSMTEAPEGISKDDFKKLLTQVMAKESDGNSTIETVDMDQLFTFFDSNNNGSLDFKEFLFLVSILLKGSFEEKIQSAFQVFDQGNKGHLTNNEFDQFLQTLIQVTVKANQNNLSPFFNQDLEKFSGKMEEITKNKEKINFNLVKKDLLNNNFIKYCEMIEKLALENDNSKLNGQKRPTDTSIAYANQTGVDSTYDTTQHTTQPQSRADDFVPVLEKSAEPSTVQEVEENQEETKVVVATEVSQVPEGSFIYNAEEVNEKTFAPIEGNENYSGVDVLSRLKSTDSEVEEIIYDNLLAPLQTVTSFDVVGHKPTLGFAYKIDIQPTQAAGKFSFQSLLKSNSDSQAFNGRSWKLDEARIDLARKPSKPVLQLEPVKIPELELEVYQPLPPQSISEKPTLSINGGYLFENYDQFGKLGTTINEEVYASVRKPLEGQGVANISIAQTTDPTLQFSWKDNCFVSQEKPVPIVEPVYESKQVKKPFAGGICEALAPHHRPFDDFGPIGWKHDHFGHQVNGALEPHSAPIDSFSFVNKPFGKNGYNALEYVEQAEYMALSRKNEHEIFEQVNRPSFALKPSESSKPIRKPFDCNDGLSPMMADNLAEIDVKPELRLFGSESKPAISHNRPSTAVVDIQLEPQAESPVFDNVAEGLEGEKIEAQPTFVVDFGTDSVAGEPKKKKKKVKKRKFEAEGDDEDQNQDQDQDGEEKAASAGKKKKKKKKKVVKETETVNVEVTEVLELDDNPNAPLEPHDVTERLDSIPKPLTKVIEVEEIVEEKVEEKIVYEEEDNPFMNPAMTSSAEKTTTVTILTKIDDTADNRLTAKRKADSTKQSLPEATNENCKLCSMF